MPINSCSINGITIDGDSSIAITDSENNWYITTTSLTYDNKLTYADNVCNWNKHYTEKHFNCPFCGAPNQIDVCEYCGSAYEGDM